jgi:hypothetical protein
MKDSRSIIIGGVRQDRFRKPQKNFASGLSRARRAPIETLKNKNGEDTKTVLYFREIKKVLPLNRTNWDLCADICGDDSDDWPGHQIEIYPTTTPFGAEVVPCVRIGAPQQKELPVPVPEPKAKPPLATEMDDEIPF